MKTCPSFSSQPCAFRAQIVLTTFSSSLLCTSPEKKKQAPSYVQSFLKTSNQLALPQDINRKENSAWQKRREEQESSISKVQGAGRAVPSHSRKFNAMLRNQKRANGTRNIMMKEKQKTPVKCILMRHPPRRVLLLRCHFLLACSNVHAVWCL